MIEDLPTEVFEIAMEIEHLPCNERLKRCSELLNELSKAGEET